MKRGFQQSRTLEEISENVVGMSDVSPEYKLNDKDIVPVQHVD